MAVDLQAQLAFVNRLRDGYVITLDEIKEYYGTKYPNRFVNSVRIRTGLDIVKAKVILDPFPRTYGGTETDVFYLVNDVHLEIAGLEFMQNLEEWIKGSDNLDDLEYQDGHYLMWSCPNWLPTKEGAELCGQFHKVDLGDETLEYPRTVRCVQCGKQYKVKPKAKI